MDGEALRNSYACITEYFKQERVSAKTTDNFVTWLLDRTHRAEKDAALKMLFEEIVFDDPDRPENEARLGKRFGRRIRSFDGYVGC